MLRTFHFDKNKHRRKDILFDVKRGLRIIMAIEIALPQ